MSDYTCIVDTLNLAHRSHWVLPELSFNGKPAGMLHGFLSAVRALQKLPAIKNLVFAWDYGTPNQARVENWRKSIYPPYKAKRKKTGEPSVVLSQLPELYNALSILGYKCIGVPGLEADDICGLITSRAGNFFLFSADDDLYQLLEGTRVKVLRRKKDWSCTTQYDVEKVFGFTIDKFPIYLALGGDRSDNIRPLPRCGSAGALSLVLGGVNPQLPYAEQPAVAQNARFALPWRVGTVLQAYQVAHIPRSTKDWRIKSLVEASPLPKSLVRKLDNIEDREEEFLQFLSAYGLMDHIAQRSKFFERG